MSSSGAARRGGDMLAPAQTLSPSAGRWQRSPISSSRGGGSPPAPPSRMCSTSRTSRSPPRRRSAAMSRRSWCGPPTCPAASRPVPVSGVVAALRGEAPAARRLDPSVRAVGNAARRSRRDCRRGRGVPRARRGRATLPKLLLLPLLDECRPGRAGAACAVERGGGAHAAFGRHQRAALQPQGDPRDYVERRDRREAPQGIRAACAAASPKPDRSHSRSLTARRAVAAALQDFLALEAKGWKGAAGTALVQSPAHAALRGDRSRRARPAGTGAAIARLLRGSRPIACIVTLEAATARGDGRSPMTSAWRGSPRACRR